MATLIHVATVVFSGYIGAIFYGQDGMDGALCGSVITLYIFHLVRDRWSKPNNDNM
jgi:hypothetical protein